MTPAKLQQEKYSDESSSSSSESSDEEVQPIVTGKVEEGRAIPKQELLKLTTFTYPGHGTHKIAKCLVLWKKNTNELFHAETGDGLGKILDDISLKEPYQEPGKELMPFSQGSMGETIVFWDTTSHGLYNGDNGDLKSNYLGSIFLLHLQEYEAKAPRNSTNPNEHSSDHASVSRSKPETDHQAGAIHTGGNEHNTKEIDGGDVQASAMEKDVNTIERNASDDGDNTNGDGDGGDEDLEPRGTSQGTQEPVRRPVAFLEGQGKDLAILGRPAPDKFLIITIDIISGSATLRQFASPNELKNFDWSDVNQVAALNVWRQKIFDSLVVGPLGQPVVPNIQPIALGIQPVLSNAIPVAAGIQPVPSNNIRAIAPNIQPAAPSIQPVASSVQSALSNPRTGVPQLLWTRFEKDILLQLMQKAVEELPPNARGPINFKTIERETQKIFENVEQKKGAFTTMTIKTTRGISKISGGPRIKVTTKDRVGFTRNDRAIRSQADKYPDCRHLIVTLRERGLAAAQKLVGEQKKMKLGLEYYVGRSNAVAAFGAFFDAAKPAATSTEMGSLTANWLIMEHGGYEIIFLLY